MKWAGALGCPETPAGASDANGVHTETHAPCAGAAEVVYIAVDGQGHTWAGGRSLLPERLVGKTSNKLRATDIVPVGTADILRAFQLRFQPESADGTADKTTMGLLHKYASIT